MEDLPSKLSSEPQPAASRLKLVTTAAVRWSAAKVGVSAGKWASDDETAPVIEDKKKKYGFMHAVVMILCFGVLISTAYTQQQPSRYTKSHISLEDALNIQGARAVVSDDDIWSWVDSVVTGIGGRVVDHIEVNCMYDQPNTQDVSINNVIYTINDPKIQTGACSPGRLSFVKGTGQVYLTGNHQLLSFGIFTDRSVPQRPIEKSNSAAYDIEVLDSVVTSLNPIRDEKIIMVCNDTTARRCVLKDAPSGEIGSTLGWSGYEQDGTYYFTEGSTATIYSASEGNKDYEPCYMYVSNETASPTAIPSNSGQNGPSSTAVPTSNNAPATPTAAPISKGSTAPSAAPAGSPIPSATPAPTPAPTAAPISKGSTAPSAAPAGSPIPAPTPAPTLAPTPAPTAAPISKGSTAPSAAPTRSPASSPTSAPMGPPLDRRLTTETTNEIEILPDTCSYMWITNGYDMRITCILDRTVQQGARLAYVASYYSYRDIFGLFSGQFACDRFASVGSDGIANTFSHGHKNLESYLENEDSYGVFFSTTTQLDWVVESTLGLLNLQRNYYIDENTRVFKVYMIARNLGREQLFYSFIKVVFYIDVDGLIRTEFDVTYVPMIQYYYGIDGYAWRVKEVFVFEIMLGILFALFTLREVYQLLVKRLLPLGTQWKQKWFAGAKIFTQISEPSERKAKIFEVTPSEDIEMRNTQAQNEHLDSSQQHSTKLDVLSTKDIHKAIDEFGDAIEDVLDDYVPDAAGMMDILDWMTITILLFGIIYRIRYISKARDLHDSIKTLESYGDGEYFNSNLESLIGKFAALSTLASGAHIITIIAVCVGIMQFFRYLSFDRKLGIVTETIYVVFFDLIPVLFIFITIVIAYGVLGTEIYGAQLREWSTLGKSIGSLFLMMLVRNVSAVETGIFFWSFIVIISMILFNMVLAVILTVYEDKYKELMESEELEKQKILLATNEESKKKK